MKIAHRLLLTATFGIGLHITIGSIQLSYAAPLNTQLPQEETILSGQLNLSQP